MTAIISTTTECITSPSGEWIINKVLGSGTFGIVYSAQEKSTGKRFALKMQPVTEKHGITQSALMEMNVMSQLQHRNIMNSERIFFETWKPIELPFVERNVIETIMFLPKTKKVEGEQKLKWFESEEKRKSDDVLTKPTMFIVIAMRKADGETLRDIMGEHRQFILAPSTIRDIFHQLFEAVAYMHKNGIMHCDLKPNNILMDLVQSSKIKIVPVIGDFGMAQMIKPEECNTTCKQKPMIQALPYQAPEVLCSNIAFAEYETKRPLVESSEMSKSKKKRMKLKAPGTLSSSTAICKSGVYDEAVDIWSMGVIIIRILLDGRTPSDEMDTSRAPQHFEKYQSVVESRESFMKWVMSDKDSWKDTMDWMSGQEDQAILSQLLEVARQCLTINPIKRPSAERILKMPPFSPPIPLPKDGTYVVDDDLYFANYRRHILSKFGCHSSTHEIANRIREEFETSENKPVSKSRPIELAYMAACCILAIKLNEPKLIISGRERYTSYNEAIAPFVLVSGSTKELLDAEIAVVAAIGFKIPFLKQQYQVKNNELNDNM